jgi:predicted dehydrogenase
MIKRNLIWLIGAGPMAIDYAIVLSSLNVEYKAIGRGGNNADLFEKATGQEVITGGLTEYLKNNSQIPSKAIVATGVESLANVTCSLITHGVKEILCEKPGGINRDEIIHVSNQAKKHSSKVLIAYNRRFYSSVIKANEIIRDDGGVTSFNFEFTEWSHIIEKLPNPISIKQNWFLANSTHVVDLAFYLGGKPKTIVSFTSGKLDWHNSSAVFSGAGESEAEALFCYHANWAAPGRWGVEILTRHHRLYFKPMEKLHIQELGSVKLALVEIDEKVDTNYKPGLFLQTKSFLSNSFEEFIDIHEQMEMIPIYDKIAGY